MPDTRKSIRPAIAVEKPAETAEESFQNEVLRPILKLQNELLLAIFRHFMEKRKTAFHKMPRLRQLQQIEQSLSKDNSLRKLLLGAVIGQFTPEEYDVFLQQESEATRRIMAMMAQRLQDQVESV
ncbi:MAG: hypothetical protein H6566_14665 [Lewinellaceae bacterium]|nr:hypothetical protein [Lewinellaceae bacterium]